jgi:hypothetical protein
MTAADSINPTDRDLMKRLTVVLVFLFVFTAAFAQLHRVYSHKFYGISGRAQWIWAHHRMSSNEPVAFFAVREFDLPENRYFTHLKLLGDPEYTVYLNGREIAGRRVGEERQLDFYDISTLVKTGRNRIVVAVRAPQGMGGLIAAIDLAPETQNWLVTDANWKIYRWWYPELIVRDPHGAAWEPPQIVGEPPIGRWNYLSPVMREMHEPPSTAAPPRETFDVIGLLPNIRTREGIAVAGADRTRATAFDFGFTTGQVRLTNAKSHFASRAVNVRFANTRGELELIEWNFRPVVFAPGETVVTTPEPHRFRYVMVFGRGVKVDVLR